MWNFPTCRRNGTVITKVNNDTVSSTYESAGAESLFLPVPPTGRETEETVVNVI